MLSSRHDTRTRLCFREEVLRRGADDARESVLDSVPVRLREGAEGKGVIFRPHKVWYTCSDCKNPFFLEQGDPAPDEDVRLCWDCIDKLFTGC